MKEKISNLFYKYFYGFTFCLLMKRNILIVFNNDGRFLYWTGDDNIFGDDDMFTWHEHTGWFLFGFIPLVLWPIEETE